MTQILRSARRTLVKTLLVLAGGLVWVTSGSGDTAPVPDTRTTELDRFFRSYNCPAPRYALDYVRAADAHNLDYRLLPAISVVESTCGIYERLNNRWGWNSAKSGFPTVAAGIEFVTSQLAHSPAYKDGRIEGKLSVYNPRPDYWPQVLRLMRQIHE